MKAFNKYLIVVLVFPFASIKAQEKLSLQKALTIALENNYSIKISKVQKSISSNDLSLGNAGFLPSLTGNLNQTNNIQTSTVDLASGGSRNANNAKTTNLNYGVSLNWKVFDGFTMFANYDRLKELEKLGELNAQLTVQTTIVNVINTYYNLISQDNQLQATKTALEVSQTRLKNANNRYKLGKGSRLELLAAKVDLNTDTTQLLRQQDLIKTIKIQLNQFLARDLSTEFEIIDDVNIDKSLVYDDLKLAVNSKNTDIQTASVNQKIAEIYIKQIKGNRYPNISLTSGYNFSQSTSPPTGFSIRSNNRGFNYGLTASINIFNGFGQNRLEKAAQLELQSANYDLQRIKQDVNANLLTAYLNYQTNLKLLLLEQSNVEVAKENLDITLEKYKLGSIVPLELREAQRNYIDANARYANALYVTKISEVSIKEITGTLSI
ncbi:TolC family protein [Pedobacter sp. SD-b]|uniref:TolC family protein n=1 Tax=Pedobacter segetis TaxID=2793069 RepID=A0ABS1BLV9_9SPHI|nr:TolC family protein [Pedobacter segetis]MBK0383291.1 TolC family protein [Pedobacter segetis]